ncbi:bis(5'-nucleosyl)-tetraphosphatase (symmetrical) ApaH [Vibrio aestuarianus]|uniref:bis(5'-nucleosyl)-tetraphosphatase (symmetrical) ApaH n=1 Tax=Vibrio aestuarianus TaxID=28171 RepID=UPI00237C9E94|nr:bis(5'-nucleosyl)-tetraphosphatase (symmetrical) ApaH [Vibrio aestuarianus]MDE1315114.1 bis(5'-nucleosyl)-tetraphosphatase (symmetrical) ApaH [Vibrio aestuarianus]
MANYIVGDIQGCFDELQHLLATVKFQPQHDTLWLAGDLVARGPKSLETLRFVKALGNSARVVLGNHDLHLLAVSIGIHPAKSRDKTLPILQAHDADELLEWLRHQPLMAEHPEFVMCHAGISPQWDLNTAREAAKEVAAVLQGENWRWLIEQMYSNTPDIWSHKLQGIERYRYIINAYTRMRFCFTDGRLDMACKLPPQQVSDDALVPWFDVPQRIPLDKTVVFGHWAALEGYRSQSCIGLDTGCVWGGTLTMLRWEDQQYFIQPALAHKS